MGLYVTMYTLFSASAAIISLVL